MPISLNDAEKVAEEIKRFSARQIAVILFLIISCVGTAFWVENRYAKIQEIEKQFSINQQQLNSAHFLSLEIFSILNDEQRKLILQKLELARQNNNKPAN
jgi:hypothetical protein